MRAQVNGSAIFPPPAVRNNRATAAAAMWLALVFQTGILFAILADNGLYNHYSRCASTVDCSGARAESNARATGPRLGLREAIGHQDRRAECGDLPPRDD